MKASDFNNIPDHLKRELKRDERAVYRILNVRPDPDNYGKYLMPAALQIPSTDTIYDRKTSQFYNIAAIERVAVDGTPTFLSIVFSANNMGFLFLNGGNAVHQKIYQFIELCNFNASNPERSEDAEVFFQRVDSKKEAQEERKMRKLIVQAVNLALELDDKRAKDVASALGIAEESMEEIRNALEDYAGDYPTEFIELVNRASVETESMLKDAIKAGFIVNDSQNSMFVWADTNKEIYKYKKGGNKNYVKEMAEYLEENNPDELKAIQTRLG